MKLEVNGKIYECNKIIGRKYDHFCEVMDKISKRQELEGQGYNVEDTKLMREVLSDIFDNKITVDDIYNDVDVADVVVTFTQIQIEILNKLNQKMAKVEKNF